MRTQTLAHWRRLARDKRLIASLIGIVAVAPVPAVATDGLNCRFTKICRGGTCQALDDAAILLRMIGFGSGTNPAALALADARLLEGPSIDEGQDLEVLFGTSAAGLPPSVQALGEWINHDDDPRREVIIAFGDEVRLTIIPSDVDGATLTREGRGLMALLGSSQAIGRCEGVDLAQD